MRAKWIQVLFPEGFWPECKAQLKIVWPLIVLSLAIHTTGTVAVAFCSRLGTVHLGAVSLAQSIITAFGFNVAVGFSAASDTLFSQIYGGENKRLMGTVLQRSLYIYTLVAILFISLYINAEFILITIGVPRETASLTNKYLLTFLPGLMCYFWYTACMKFIQNQDKINGNMFIGLSAAVINILLHYIFLRVDDMNILGSSVAFCFTFITAFIMTVAYIFVSDMLDNTWDGCTTDAWQNWGQFFILGFAGIFLSGFEWWMVEIGLIFSGSLGEVALGSFSILLQVEMPISNIFLALGYAANIRVGHHLGGSKPLAAMTASAVSVTLSVISGLVFAILCFCLRFQIPKIFTSNSEVLDLSSHLFIALGSFIFFEAVNTTCNGILKGCGLQYAGAIVSFFGFGLALAGLPIMHYSPLSIEGYWVILTCCSIINAIGKVCIISDTDWKQQVLHAFKRTRSLASIEDDGEYKGKVDAIDDYDYIQRQEDIQDLLLGSKEERLPLGNLICRRTLLILFFVAILATSIAIKVNVDPTPPECAQIGNCTLADISNTSLPQHLVRTFVHLPAS